MFFFAVLVFQRLPDLQFCNLDGEKLLLIFTISWRGHIEAADNLFWGVSLEGESSHFLSFLVTNFSCTVIYSKYSNFSKCLTGSDWFSFEWTGSYFGIIDDSGSAVDGWLGYAWIHFHLFLLNYFCFVLVVVSEFFSQYACCVNIRHALIIIFFGWFWVFFFHLWPVEANTDWGPCSIA